MKAENPDPQLRAVYRFSPNPPIRWAWGRAFVRAALKALPAAKLPVGVRSEHVHSPGGEKAIVFTPAGGGNGAALLYMHGGGIVIGTVAQGSSHLARLAAELDIVTVSVDYRLAPEYPYPVPMDDCFAACAGLSPLEILRATTSQPAKYLDRTDRMGRIATGMDADLLLLDADPLASIEGLSSISLVMRAGHAFTAGELEARVDRLVKAQG